MQVVCLGLSHKSAPVEVREKFAVGDSHLGEVAVQIAHAPGVGEAVIISTCNRVEYYLAAEDPSRATEAVLEFAQSRGAADPNALHPLRGDDGVRHLFRVVSGIESMVLGETEILGQVKKAYQAAQTAGATSRHLNKLFQRAFSVAKEVRTHTSITRGSVSVGSAAVELAEKIFGQKLDHCKAMILGAGETAEITARALQLRGVQSIFVSNRTYERAHALAEQLNGRAIHFEEWDRELGTVDILIGSTGAPHAVVTKAKLAPVMHRRADRPLYCIDLAVPRDFEPAVNDLDGVYLYNIDELQHIADTSMKERHAELAKCDAMIERHVAEYREWLTTPRPEIPLRVQAEGAK